VGVHLDRKAGLEHVAEIRRDIEKLGRKTQYFNINAADERSATKSSASSPNRSSTSLCCCTRSRSAP